MIDIKFGNAERDQYLDGRPFYELFADAWSVLGMVYVHAAA